MWIKRKHIGKYKRVYNKTIYRTVYVHCLVGIYCVRKDVWEWGWYIAVITPVRT